MSYKPFKMRGSPFKRNFGVGDNESPDAPSPLNQFDFGKAIMAGMETLPGGEKQEEETEGTEYERDEDGKLIIGADGKPIPVENPAEKKTEGTNIIDKLLNSKLFKNVKSKISGK